MKFWQWEHIPRHDNQEYLDRLIVFRCKWFGIMIHWFKGSDDECMHNHPWNFWTWIVKGGYWEWTEHKLPDGSIEWCKWYPRWSLLRRPAHWIHKVEYNPTNPAVTIVIHGPKKQSWGFFTPKGYKPHAEYSWKDHCGL